MSAPYSFVSEWRIPATAQRCWAELERMVTRPQPGLAAAHGRGADPQWWPSLRVEKAPPALVPGGRIVLAVRSPLGYRLRVRLTVEQVTPGRLVRAASAGDLTGWGSIRIEEDAEGESTITVEWNVATERRWMNAMAWLLRPLFVRAHAHVMRDGERGLRAELARRD